MQLCEPSKELPLKLLHTGVIRVGELTGDTGYLPFSGFIHGCGGNVGTQTKTYNVKRVQWGSKVNEVVDESTRECSCDRCIVPSNEGPISLSQYGPIDGDKIAILVAEVAVSNGVVLASWTF